MATTQNVQDVTPGNSPQPDSWHSHPHRHEGTSHEQFGVAEDHYHRHNEDVDHPHDDPHGPAPADSANDTADHADDDPALK